MADEVTLLVAEASVHEQVNMVHDVPDTVDLEGGDVLRVRMSYRVHDQPKPEELWTFQLITRVDDDDESVSERIHRDRKLLSDDVISNVGVDLDFPTAGTFTLYYEAFAQVAHRDWDDRKKFTPVSSEKVQGSVTVTVH